MNRRERIEYMKVLEEREIRRSREDLLTFTRHTMPTFEPSDFHRRYYEILDQFAHEKIKKLMVFMPPQHGKSEGSTRRLPSDILGLFPDKRLGIISFNASKARKFNREIQRIIDSPEYNEVFPETTLFGSPYTQPTATEWVRSSDECEIVNHAGGFKTVGVGGPLTGDPIDVLIMDDLYKDAKTAWSKTVRDSVEDWYDTVADTRLHNDSQQLIVFTRWHEDDLAGHLLKLQGEFDADTNPDGWVVVKFPAIKIGAPTEFDPRQEGEPLWPERHSLEGLEKKRIKNPHVFESLYQQDPKPVEGLMYESGFRTYTTIPYSKTQIRKNYTDTADTGSDYLCSINYVETDIYLYVTNVLFTQRPMEYTETKTAEMLCRDAIEEANIESNNGGRGFARNVEKIVRDMGNNVTKIKWFAQTENKDARIFTHSAEVQNLVIFPEGWDRMWPEFYNAISGYMKMGKNAHDDAPDALTGCVEKRSTRKKRQNLSGLF